MRYSKKKKQAYGGRGGRANTKKKRAAKRLEQKRIRQAEKLEKRVDKAIKKYDNKNLSHIRRYNATRGLPQYTNVSDRINNAKVFLKDDAKMQSSSRLKWVANMVAKSWTKEKAEGLYDLVTTDVYNQFRQKYKPPSDYYDILLEDFAAEDIERAMMELNQSNDYEQGNYKSSEVINALYDILIDRL